MSSDTTKEYSSVDSPARPNTVAIGDDLRDHVISLLEARAVKVEREIRLGVKRVDVLATFEDDLERRRIAIECKNLDRNLGQQDVARGLVFCSVFQVLF